MGDPLIKGVNRSVQVLGVVRIVPAPLLVRNPHGGSSSDELKQIGRKWGEDDWIRG